MALEPYGDNLIPVIPVDEHELLHTDDHPFCWNPACECHEDELSIYQVFLHVQDGLMTPDEATLFVSGRTF